MAIQVGQFKKGTTFVMDGYVFKVLEFQHVKPGKGPAFVRTKLRNVMTGATIDKTMTPNEKFEPAEVEKKEMQYLYSDDDAYYLMDTETYEQIPASKEDMGSSIKYIKENDNLVIHMYNGKIIEVEAPTFVNLKVEYTEPGFNGNTATTSGKPATMENGLTVEVPLFINIGDELKIDTRNGSYVERVKK